MASSVLKVYSSLILLLTILHITSATVLPPRLSTNATIVRVKEGQNRVVLECVLEVGDNPVSYMWLKDNEWVTGSLGYAYRAYKKVLLALHTIRREHQGTYTCKCSNSVGMHTVEIKVVLDKDDSHRRVSFNPDNKPLPEEILTDVAASLNDVLAEGDCECDLMFLIHANPDVPEVTIGAQANLIHTITDLLISKTMRISIQTYTDYLNTKLTFGEGTNRCALKHAFDDLSHQQWSTRLQPVIREVFKKFRKSTSSCKVLFMPIFGSAGEDGSYLQEAKHLRKSGVKIFLLDVTKEPTRDGPMMASTRGDGKPYYWYFPYSTWPSLITYMNYMVEDLTGCMKDEVDIPGVCVGEGSSCDDSKQCHGHGIGCVDGTCQFLECNVDSTREGCCATPGEFWCGDVTRNCTSTSYACDGYMNCMNGQDEALCDIKPCKNKIARCQTSHLCLGLYDLCDGESHCPGGEDEDPRFCRSFPCPPGRKFRCSDGKCIDTKDLCDGAFMQCSNGEDEALDYCSKVHSCPVTASFKCDYGKCINEESVCDGVYNCLDATDELLCIDKNCPAIRPFKCDDGLCIEEFYVCNGIIDACSDGSDEKNCTDYTCPFERSYKCNNGICIHRLLECNGQDDCNDNSDELHCTKKVSSTTPRNKPSTTDPPSFTSSACKEYEYQCRSGACISNDQVCDSRRNCIKGDDELNCDKFECPSDRSYRCKDQTCVNATFCDGIPDCADASDEENCTELYDSTEINPSEGSPEPDSTVEDVPSDKHQEDVDIVIDEPKAEVQPNAEPEAEPQPESSPVEDTDNVLSKLTGPDQLPSVSIPDAPSDSSKKGAASTLICQNSLILVMLYIYYLLMR